MSAVLDDVLNPPVRLQVAAILARANEAEFAIIRDIVEVSDSVCLLYTSPSPRDRRLSRMPSSA